MKFYSTTVVAALLACQTNAYEQDFGLIYEQIDTVSYGNMLTCLGCDVGFKAVDSLLTSTKIHDGIMKIA